MHTKMKVLVVYATKESTFDAWKTFPASYHTHNEWRDLGINRYEATVRCMETQTDTTFYFRMASDQLCQDVAGMEFNSVRIMEDIPKNIEHFLLSRKR